MSDDRQPIDPDLEARVRGAFARLEPPTAPPTVVDAARALAARVHDSPRGRWAPRLPFAFAAIAVLVTAGFVSALVSQGRHSTTQGEDVETPVATVIPGSGSGALLSESEAIAAAQAGIEDEVPEIHEAPVADARLDRYANAVDTFAYRPSPEPDADQQVWVIDFTPGPGRRGATVVVDATDGRILFWATFGG